MITLNQFLEASPNVSGCLLAFDLDGTLVDSYEVHKAAYELAGYMFYDKRKFTMTAREWGCTPELSERKTQNMSKVSHFYRYGPAYQLFKDFWRQATILTGASLASFTAASEFLQIPIEVGRVISADSDLKFNTLLELGRKYQKMYYFDDSKEMCQRVESIKNCLPILVN